MAKAAVNTGPALAVAPFALGDQKAATEAAGATRSTVLMVPIEHVKIKVGFNIRVIDSPTYEEKLTELTRSITQEGFYSDKPLKGFVDSSGDFIILDGHRRFEAAKRAVAAGATITKLPMILTKDIDPVSVNVGLIKSNTGDPLKMAEKAVVVKRLLKHGMSEDDIATRLDMTIRYVGDLKILIEAPKAIREAVKNDKLSGTEAVKILRKHSKKFEDDPKAAAKAAEAEVTSMVEKANARGAKKATAQDSEEGTKGGAKQVTVVDEETGEEKVVKVRPMVHKTVWAVSKGDHFAIKGTEFKLMGKLPGDSDWYSLLTDKEGFAEALEDVKFEIKITRPKKAGEAKTEPKSEAAAPARKGKVKKPPAEETTSAAAESDLIGDVAAPEAGEGAEGL